MTGLKLVDDKCRVLRLDVKLCTPILREVLKIGGKDLRAAPFIHLILESMPGKTKDELFKALEITKDKLSTLDKGASLNPKYFVAVLKNIKSATNSKNNYDFNQNLNWGKSI